jgi:hypothetical protein
VPPARAGEGGRRDGGAGRGAARRGGPGEGGRGGGGEREERESVRAATLGHRFTRLPPFYDPTKCRSLVRSLARSLARWLSIRAQSRTCTNEHDKCARAHDNTCEMHTRQRRIRAPARATLAHKHVVLSFLAASPLFGALHCRRWLLLTNRGFRSRPTFASFFFLSDARKKSGSDLPRATVIEITDRCHERAFELFIGTVLLRADLL